MRIAIHTTLLLITIPASTIVLFGSSPHCEYERSDGWMKVHSVQTGRSVSPECTEKGYAVVRYLFVVDSSDSARARPVLGRDTAEYILCSSDNRIAECLARIGIREGSYRRLYQYRRTNGGPCSPGFVVLDTAGWMYPGCTSCIGVPAGCLAER